MTTETTGHNSKQAQKRHDLTAYFAASASACKPLVARLTDITNKYQS